MIKLRHDIFITLLVTLCLVETEARYPPKSMHHRRNAKVLEILQRGYGYPAISNVLSNTPKRIFRIGNPGVATTHRDNPKPGLFAGSDAKAVIPIGNPAVETMLRNNLRALRGGNPKISAMRDNFKPFLIAGIPEISATPHGNRKPNPQGDMLLAMLREYTKPLLNNPALLRIRKHSESDNHLVPTSGIKKYTIKDNDLKETFNKMIETVANVNDERILSLNKFFELEHYLPQVSRTTKQKNPLIAIIMNKPNYKSNFDNLNKNHQTEDPQYVIVKKKQKQPNMVNMLEEIIEDSYSSSSEDDDKESISQEIDERSRTKNFYLRGWKGCKKSAAKYCRKACKKAFKLMCDDYKCSRKFKKDGKKECKKRCKAEFLDPGSDKSSSEF